jgi:sensor histidine kinase YesM
MDKEKLVTLLKIAGGLSLLTIPVILTVFINYFFTSPEIKSPCDLKVKLISGSQNYMHFKLIEKNGQVHTRLFLGSFNNFQLIDGIHIETFKVMEYCEGKEYAKFPWLRQELESIVNAEPPYLHSILINSKLNTLENQFDGVLFHENKKQTIEPPKLP